MQRLATLAAVAAGLAIAGPAAAQEFPKTHLKVVGSISTLPPYRDYELPFWTKHLARNPTAPSRRTPRASTRWA